MKNAESKMDQVVKASPILHSSLCILHCDKRSPAGKVPPNGSRRLTRSFVMPAGRLIVAALIACFLCAPAHAADLAFRRHTLNADSAFPSCAVIDVNHDGKLDIVSGGFWYEAPTWQKHFLRDVEMIGGRYDDYSNLPLDVNGDGWPDLVSANYRSRKLYWIEHPGKSLGAWTPHVVDTPGPMETARLFDIDGDGRLDVLPNDVQSPAWWEVVVDKAGAKKGDPSGRPTPRWVKHD